jgi:ubiquinone biosynthesis protein
MVQWMRTCPTLHKLGQLLARDRRLPVEFRAELQKLESLESQTSIEQIQPVIEAELGALPDRRIRLTDAPLAEASVAVVVPFDSPHGGGVLKVLKPGIEERLEEDLKAWQALADFLDMHRARLHLDHVDYRDTLQRVRDLLCNEVNLTTEQDHLAEAAALYDGRPQIAIPKLLPYCSPKITAMEFLDGDHVTSTRVGENHRWLATSVAEALVAVPIFSDTPNVLFHADPHAGNLLVTGDDRLGLIDWGLAGHLSKFDREQLTQVLVGCLTFDPSRICAALDALAVRVEDTRALRDRVEWTLLKSAHEPSGGIQCMMDLLDSVVIGGDVVFAEDKMLFRKLVHITEGVIADLDPGCTLDRVLWNAGFQQFCRDGFFRTLAAPCSRAFGTHLSNWDLAELMCCGPLVALRRWQLLAKQSGMGC